MRTARLMQHFIRNFRKAYQVQARNYLQSTAVIVRQPFCLQNWSNTTSINIARYSHNKSAPAEDTATQADQLDHLAYDRACTETLNGLCEYFEELTENATHLSGSDVSYGDGVLTVQLGREYGTYVINRQTPNKQIWLSSPTSGPKRYDFVGPKTAETGKWIYKHTGESLHELLQKEMAKILKTQVDFYKLPYGS